MAALSDSERATLQRQFCEAVSTAGTGAQIGTLTRAELRAAINAIDQWADDNAAAFNLAIPQPARAQLSAKAKAELLNRVVRRRFEVS